MESNEIRQAFLDFFRSKGHEIVPSAPMVVKGDPTLMFTNAGMNQFKDIFLGNAPRKYPRAADTQKCLRVSGKHNDLEEVGHDTYHHTMFEMLGNWSYGDYFKREAIEWAWELLTEVYKLPAERMYATVFEGSEEDGVPFDSEAYDVWARFLPADHIIRGNKHDNFWEMGETGPCGPCSEIHFDLRDEAEIAARPGREMVNTGHPQVIEIWNLVFMQFNRKANGTLEPLPAKNVDTGMGFERLCMIMQGKKSNYDTDVFQPTIGRLAALSGKSYGADARCDVAMRVVADHLRAIAFSIADGQLPSNVKAGYVIRRILRRAVRYGYTYLGFTEPFICKLVAGLVAQMGDQFPELRAQQTLIERVIEEEESSFLRTLATGITLLDGVIAEVKKQGGTKISGHDAFVLYDTYGFPIDLTELIAREQDVEVDLSAFETELQAQKERSRNAAAVATDDWQELFPLAQSEFVGYDTLTAPVRIARYRRVSAKNRTTYQLVFDRTPFYGNSGGQIGDVGFIENADEKIDVVATDKENGLIIHIVDKLPENPAADFTAVVDPAKRQAAANNHTATHLLDAALRKVLGTHGCSYSDHHARNDFRRRHPERSGDGRCAKGSIRQVRSGADGISPIHLRPRAGEAKCQPEDNEQLCRLAQKGDTAARDILLEKNLGFIRKIALEQYRNMGLDENDIGIDLDDLMQEGSIGLLNTIPLFDAGRGMKFLTYAAPALRNAMTDCIRAALGLFEQRMVDKKDGPGFQRVYLDDVLSEDERMLRIEAIADPHTQTPEQIYIQKEQLIELYAALDKLTAREVLQWC